MFLTPSAITAAVLLSIGHAQTGGRIGQLEVRVTGLDVGPVATAEVGPWELQPGQQFIIVRLAVSNEGRVWNCTTFDTRLQTDNAADYQAEQTIVEPQGEVHAIRGLSVGARRTVRLVFRVPEQARPTTVVLQRETDAEAACWKERGGGRDRSAEVRDTLSLPLAGLPTRTDLVITDGQVMARLGDLMIVPTAVRVVPAVHFGKRSDPPKRGYRFVAVDVQATNTGKLPNCTDFTTTLTVDAGYKYSPRRPDNPHEPKLGDLLAGERAAGSYVFEVEDGLTPRWLTVTRSFASWSGCSNRSESASTSGPVRLPLPGEIGSSRLR